MTILGHRVTFITAPFCGVCEMDCSEGKPGRSEACPEVQAPLAHAVMDQLWCTIWIGPKRIAMALGMTDMLGVERVEIVCDMLAAHGLAEGGPSSYRRRLKRSS
jgi:hypothetical protein